MENEVNTFADALRIINKNQYELIKSLRVIAPEVFKDPPVRIDKNLKDISKSLDQIILAEENKELRKKEPYIIPTLEYMFFMFYRMYVGDPFKYLIKNSDGTYKTKNEIILKFYSDKEWTGALIS